MSALLGMAGWVRDPAGKFCWLKTVTLAAAIIPGAWLALRWAGGDLGARSLNAAIHESGTWAVRFLLLSLAVTPARWLLEYPKCVRLRRMLGVTAACYAGAHFTLYVIDQQGDLLHVGAEIALRFYLTIGFVALLGMMALAFTSTNAWQKRLGRNWKRLHKLAYPIAVLAIFHHFLQAKADVSDAAFSAGVFVWLMLWRIEPPAWRSWRWPLIGLAALALAATALIEAGWYGAATGISFWRVLDANLHVSRGLRPSEWVGILALMVLALSLARSAWKPKPRAGLDADQRRSRNSRPTLTSGLPS